MEQQKYVNDLTNKILFDDDDTDEDCLNTNDNNDNNNDKVDLIREMECTKTESITTQVGNTAVHDDSVKNDDVIEKYTNINNSESCNDSNSESDNSESDDSESDDSESDDSESDDSESEYEETNEEIIIGIDLGTTNSCVSVWRNGNLEIIPDEYGHKTVPSCVAYTKNNRYVGNDAKNQKDLNPENVFYEVKRLIGRKSDDPFVMKEKRFLSYEISEDEAHNIRLVSSVKDNLLTPEEIQAAILTKLKVMASSYLKTPIEKAVITIPAYFNDGQRQATKDAATIAGLECVRIINEPISAALAYGLVRRSVAKVHELNKKKKDKSEFIENVLSEEDKNKVVEDDSIINDDNKITILVYDFGGGTLDVSLLNVDNGEFEVVGSSGNTRLGGSDFDNKLINFSIAKFSRMNNIKEIEKIQSLSLQRLRQSCERAKKILSTSSKTYIAVPKFYDDIDLYFSITRDEFELLCEDLFLISMLPIDDILQECDIIEDDIDEIILVGGMTRMPRVRQLIHSKFGKPGNCSMNPEEAISAGAAIQAYMISHRRDPFSKSISLVDTTALSLGVETVGGVMDVLIPRKTIIPAEAEKEYTTDTDDVTSIIVKIYEGERSMTEDNFFVGEFELTGFKPAPRGVPEIIVTISIDSNGIIIVSAENKKTKDKTTVTVTGNKGRLSENEIDRLIDEAKDAEFKDEIDKRKKLYSYEIDDFCNNIITNLKRDEFKLTEEDKIIILDDVTKVLQWSKSKKYNEISDEDYEQVTEKLKRRYGILILNGNSEVMEQVKASEGVDDDKNATTVFGNDEADEEEVRNTFQKLEIEQIGAMGMTDPEIAELKEIRQNLTDLCYSIFDVVSSSSFSIDEDHLQELKYYIDDTMLWLHVHNEPKKAEFKMKIDEVNETCNKILSHYEEQGRAVFKKDIISENTVTKRDELENMCLAIKFMIDDGAFPNTRMARRLIRKLGLKINDLLDWLTENDIKSVDESETFDVDDYCAQCDIKLCELNDYCTQFNSVISGIHLNPEKDIFGGDRVIISGPEIETHTSDVVTKDQKMSTSLLDIVRNRQIDIFEDLLDKEEDEDIENIFIPNTGNTVADSVSHKSKISTLDDMIFQVMDEQNELEDDKTNDDDQCDDQRKANKTD
jgi:heat shock 70kDa protein 1/2/6/8